MNKQLVSVLSAVFITGAVFAVSTVSADTCTTQYGSGSYGTTTCVPTDLTVNKKVRTPLGSDFVENLGENDLRFSPDGTIVFQIAVTNSGNQTFEEVKVKDTLPNYVINATVPAEYNGTSNDDVLEFTIKDLKAGETKTVEVTGKIDQDSAFAKDRSLFCEINKVEVRSEDRFDDDDARFCIQTNTLGITSLPKAGLDDYLPLVPFLILGGIGVSLILQKKATINA